MGPEFTETTLFIDLPLSIKVPFSGYKGSIVNRGALGDYKIKKVEMSLYN